MTFAHAYSTKFGGRQNITQDISQWMEDGNFPHLWLAGRVVVASRWNDRWQLTLVKEVPFFGNVKYGRSVLMKQAATTQKRKENVLLRLGFTETEIGTAKLLKRIGVVPE